MVWSFRLIGGRSCSAGSSRRCRRSDLDVRAAVTPPEDHGHMDLWYPPDDQPPLLGGGPPVRQAAAAARHERVPWPIHADEFELQGRVDRGERPAVWVYRHHRSGEELYLDDTGRPYKFTRTPNGRSYGR